MHESKEMNHWVTSLSIAEFVGNNSPIQSTRYTHFFLNYGYHPCSPINVIKDSEKTTTKNINQFTLRMQQAFS